MSSRVLYNFSLSFFPGEAIHGHCETFGLYRVIKGGKEITQNSTTQKTATAKMVVYYFSDRQSSQELYHINTHDWVCYNLFNQSFIVKHLDYVIFPISVILEWSFYICNKSFLKYKCFLRFSTNNIIGSKGMNISPFLLHFLLFFSIGFSILPFLQHGRSTYFLNS